MPNLWTPWRLAYLTSDKSAGGCIFCDALAANDDDKQLVLHRGSRAFVMLNRYPYANGHLLIAPNDHVGHLSEAEPDAITEVMALATVSEMFLDDAMHPEGLNLGMNVGRSAGAGVVGHLHLHVVPRWEGDTNYMSVVNDLRVIPERLEDTYAKLKERFAALG